MARHARVVDRRTRTTRLSTLIIVWLGGLAAGFFGLLSAAARYGCGTNDKGFACRGSGSLVGVLIVLAVVAIVTAATVTTHDRGPRQVVWIGGLAVVALAFCFVAARSLLGTV